jgi:hypothetical protein
MRKLYFFFLLAAARPNRYGGRQQPVVASAPGGKTIPPQALDFTIEVNACMETKGTLQNVNSESHVNETISRISLVFPASSMP